MNQEDANGQQRGAKEQKRGKFAFGGFAERDERLHQRKKQRQIAEVDHVDVSVHFGAAILEKAADGHEMRRDACRIVNGDSVGRGEQVCIDARGVLMENEHGEDVAPEHADED